MKLFKTVDEKLYDLGFKKIEEDPYSVIYARKNGVLSYTHYLDIFYRCNGIVSVQSYGRYIKSGEYYNIVELTGEEVKLAYKKSKEIKRRIKRNV